MDLMNRYILKSHVYFTKKKKRDYYLFALIALS